MGGKEAHGASVGKYTARLRQFGAKFGYTAENQSVTKVEWAFGGLMLLACFLLFHYSDMDSIVYNSYVFVKSVQHGEFFQFYENSITYVKTDWSANYDIPIYIVFGLWNLPVFVLYDLAGIDFTRNIFSIYWTQLLIMLFLVLSAVVLYKICRQAGVSAARGKFAAFLFVTSFFTIISTTIVSNCDILPLFLMLLGILNLMRGRRKAFVICFLIAIPMKLFALMAFLPLVLLFEKRVPRIVLYLASGMSLQVVCKLLYHSSNAYRFATGSNMRSTIENMCNTTLDLGASSVSMFIGAYCLICVFAYCRKFRSKAEEYKLYMYIPLLVFSSMVCFTWISTYWVVMIAPFAAASIVMNPKFLKLNLFLEIGYSVVYLYMRAIAYSFTLLQGDSSHTLLGKLFPVHDGETHKFSGIADLFDYVSDANDYLSIAVAVFVVCLFAQIVLCFPRNTEEIGNTEQIGFSVLWARFVANLLPVLIIVYSFAKIIPAPLFSTLEPEGATSNAVALDYNLLSAKTVISQTLIFDRDRTLEDMTLVFENKAGDRKNMATLTVSIADDAGSVIFSKDYGTSIIPDGEKFVVDLHGVSVKAGKTYTVSFAGKPDQFNDPIYVCVTKDFAEKDMPVLINGYPRDYNLYMEIR
ncbi:MAG: hypothetical protein QM689_04140 [Oscillospiraceae bacterium]